MNDEKITTLDMFQILREEMKLMRDEIKSVRDEMKSVREEIKESETRLRGEIQHLREDVQSIDRRLRVVEDAVAGKKAVSTFQKTIMDWLFRVAAAVGVGGAIKAFFS